MRSPGLKAGLIGGLVLAIVDLLGLIPVVGCITLPLELLLFLGIGALAGFWMAPPRSAGPAAGQGAIAGLIAGAIGGLVNVLLAPVSLAISGGSDAILRSLPPESLQALESAGIDPYALASPGAMAGLTAVCCLPLALLLGAGLGALGAAILAGTKPE